MAHVTPDGPAEMLECLDILLSAAIYDHEVEEHTARVVAFADHYADDEYVPYLDDEYIAQSEVLAALRPVPPYTKEEFQTALWQTAQLGMNLLLDQEALILTLDDLTQEKQVSQIITPELDEIKRINER